ncbi:hypothetical protein ACLB2K_036161 [Fragaria x ananassa]
MAGDSGKDKAIVVRVVGLDGNYWYVIEERSAIDVDDDNTMIRCESDHDRVRRLCKVSEDQEPSLGTSSLVVLKSTIYLIGGHGERYPPDSDDERVGYRRLDLGGGGWRLGGGGRLMNYQYGGAAVGPDGNIYTVGYNIYRFSPHGTFHEEFVSPPSIKEPHLLGVTSKTLFMYTVHGGVDGANRMLGFDFESRRWDVLSDYYRGKWSAGVGLPTDGKVLPFIFRPDPVVYMPSYYEAFLFQIGNQDPHKLALLWDAHGSIFWAKFVLNRTTDHFCATSVSSGSCPLDDDAFEVINCAAGIEPQNLLLGVGAAWRTANVEPGSTVAIFGRGSIGLAVKFVYGAFKKLRPGIPLKCLHDKKEQYFERLREEVKKTDKQDKENDRQRRREKRMKEMMKMKKRTATYLNWKKSHLIIDLTKGQRYTLIVMVMVREKKRRIKLEPLLTQVI